MKGTTHRDVRSRISQRSDGLSVRDSSDETPERFVMSDEKKRDRALQRRVRERMEKTGESYQAAWRHVSGSDGGDGEKSIGELPTSRRSPLSLSTNDVRILPGQSAQITGRPQIASFWPDRLL